MSKPERGRGRGRPSKILSDPPIIKVTPSREPSAKSKIKAGEKAPISAVVQEVTNTSSVELGKPTKESACVIIEAHSIRNKTNAEDVARSTTTAKAADGQQQRSVYGLPKIPKLTKFIEPPWEKMVPSKAENRTALIRNNEHASNKPENGGERAKESSQTFGRERDEYDALIRKVAVSEQNAKMLQGRIHNLEQLEEKRVHAMTSFRRVVLPAIGTFVCDDSAPEKVLQEENWESLKQLIEQKRVNYEQAINAARAEVELQRQKSKSDLTVLANDLKCILNKIGQFLLPAAIPADNKTNGDLPTRGGMKDVHGEERTGLLPIPPVKQPSQEEGRRSYGSVTRFDSSWKSSTSSRGYLGQGYRDNSAPWRAPQRGRAARRPFSYERAPNRFGQADYGDTMDYQPKRARPVCSYVDMDYATDKSGRFSY